MKKISAIVLVLVLALSLLTACSNGGDTPIGDNSTPGISSTSAGTDSTGGDNTPTGDNSTPGTSETPSETEGTWTEKGTISVAGAIYRSARCEFSLPEGLVCSGTGKDGERPDGSIIPAYMTQWIGNYTVHDDMIPDGFVVAGDDLASDSILDSDGFFASTGMNFIIVEFHDRFPDFENRTAEEWYYYKESLAAEPPADIAYSVENLEIENSTIDGFPAIRLSWEIHDQYVTYEEYWAIDTPAGGIAIYPSNIELNDNYEQHSQWVNDIVSSIRIDP